MDYDVVIIDPDIHIFYGYDDEQYQGKRCLDDTRSFRLKEHLEHWRREILEAVKSGKNIFILLNQKQEIFVATGKETYSGTGRNRQTTRHVAVASNYEMMPTKISVTNSNGSSMKLVGKDNILTVYWKAMSGNSEFKTLLEGKAVQPIIQTKTGGKIVGAILQDKSSEGNLILLPYVNFDLEEYTYENEKDGGVYWTDEAVTLGKKFISSICSTNKSINSSGDMSAVPDWLIQDKYVLPKEKKIRGKLITTETKIENLQKEKEQLEQEISDESLLKHLLYETGKPLEAAVHMGLEIIGFDVSSYEDSESEFDVVFECKEGRLIGEVEGKDNKAINIDKLRQLEMNIHEDYARDEVTEIAKGALIGNANRLSEPEERGDFFTTKCLTAANRSGSALICTTDLFYVAKYLSGKADNKYAKECRQAILSTTGLVSFPDIQGEVKKEIDSDK